METTRNHPALNLLLVALILLGMYIGKHLLIPLVMALVIWYLINAISSQFARINYGSKKAPKWVNTTASIGVVFFVFRFVGKLVVNNLVEFEKLAPDYNRKLQELSALLSEKIGSETIQEITNEIDVAAYAGQLVNSSISFLTALFVVLFYVIFIMTEQNIFGKKLDLIFTHRKNKVQFFQTMERIDTSMKKYMSVKSLLSLIVSVSAYIILISFGVDFAILWAFLAFLLNFIPFVGSFVAIVFPSLLSLLQFGDPFVSLGVFLILNAVQVVVGNFLEPKMVGKSLNLSPLVVVLALAFWGALWGVAGMFLCVPMTVALMIILSQFPSTRTAAILLSAGDDPSGSTVANSDDSE